MKVQITWEDLNFTYLLGEFTLNAYSGHRSHAKKSNKLLQDWITKKQDALEKVNVVWMDFYTPDLNK